MATTYQIDCKPDGTINVEQNDGILPAGMLIDLPNGDHVAITDDFVRNVHRRMFGEEER